MSTTTVVSSETPTGHASDSADRVEQETFSREKFDLAMADLASAGFPVVVISDRGTRFSQPAMKQVRPVVEIVEDPHS